MNACKLSDLQRVDAIVRHIGPSSCEFCESEIGFRLRDWLSFRQFLVNVFGSVIPHHQSRRGSCSAMSKTLPNSEWLAEQKCSSTAEIFCYSAPPLIHVGHLSENDRDAAFWHGFHPVDCDVIWPHLLSKNPFQPPEVSFNLEDVFSCARRVFAYQFS